MENGYYRINKNLIVFVVGMIILLVSACSLNQQEQYPMPSLTSQPTMTLTQTETPTSTPTPLPPVSVLLAPPEADKVIVNALQERLSTWIPLEGLRFQILPSMDKDDFKVEHYKYIIAVPPVPNMNSLVLAAPEVKFLAIGFDNLIQAPNLSTIAAGENLLDEQAFLAGYIATMITPDWRVGMIGVADSPLVDTARKGFINGALFYCPSPMGVCNPTYAPFYEYPLYVEMNKDASEADWRSAAKYLKGLAVETVYVMPGAGGDSLLNYLAEQGINLIGGKTPPSNIKDHWVATLGFSPLDALDDYWQEFIGGSVSKNVAIPIEISDINQDLLSPGKQRLAEEVLADLTAGYIDTGVGAKLNTEE